MLAAEPDQRIDTRQGHANGFKPKTLNTRLGQLSLAVPQVRGDISSAQVSRAAASPDEELAKWRSRRLDAEAYPYLALDARYEKVRVDGAVLSCAVLIAGGAAFH